MMLTYRIYAQICIQETYIRDLVLSTGGHACKCASVRCRPKKNTLLAPACARVAACGFKHIIYGRDETRGVRGGRRAASDLGWRIKVIYKRLTEIHALMLLRGVNEIHTYIYMLRGADCFLYQVADAVFGQCFAC